MTVRPIELADLWAFVAAQKQSVPRSSYQAICRAVAAGDVLGAFGPDGVPVAIGGAAPVQSSASGLAWLSVRPGGLGRLGLPVVRAMIRHLAMAAEQHGSVVAVVDDDNGNGQRLARLVGMVPTDAVIAGLRTWSIDGRTDRQDGESTIRAGS